MDATDHSFMQKAFELALKASCPRFKVGIVLVKRGVIMASAYNGALDGFPSCERSGCLVVGGHCVRTMHAEPKVIAYCVSRGISSRGSTAYMTWFPCFSCMNLLVDAGLKKLVYATVSDPNNNYGKEFEEARLLALNHGMELVEYRPE